MNGLRVPPTNGTEYGRVLFQAYTDTNDIEPTQVFDPTQDVGSIAIRCPASNNGAVYIGWDEDVNTDNGFPLYKRDSFGLDLNVKSQPIYAVAEVDADEVRVIATN